MLYGKMVGYITRIFYEATDKKNFNLYSSDSNTSVAGGKINNSGESYFLSVNKNKIGLKINDEEYFFSINRMPFNIAAEHGDIFNGFGEDLKKQFKDVEFVECFELDKRNQTVILVDYLVNKSAFLLIGCEN